MTRTPSDAQPVAWRYREHNINVGRTDLPAKPGRWNLLSEKPSWADDVECEGLFPQSALGAERQKREAAEKERDEAILLMSDWARKAGEAEGALKASEMAGVVDGWKSRADTAESSLAKANERIAELEMAFHDIAGFHPDPATGVDAFEQIARHARATTLAALQSNRKG